MNSFPATTPSSLVRAVTVGQCVEYTNTESISTRRDKVTKETHVVTELGGSNQYLFVRYRSEADRYLPTRTLRCPGDSAYSRGYPYETVRVLCFTASIQTELASHLLSKYGSLLT